MSPQVLTLQRGAESRPACFAVVDEAELQARFATPDSFLSASESTYFGALRFPQKKQEFLLGRLAAKMALGALLGEPDWRRFDIRSGVFGQPLVHHPCVECIEVTVSHSKGLAVALAYPGAWPMGIDLECVPESSAATIIGELEASAAEHAWLAASAIGAPAACGVLWSAREALGKSMKIGLNCPLGILALGDLQPCGAGAWAGRYTNFPQSKCLSQVIDGWVLTLAMPAEIELAPWPQLRQPSG